LERVFILDIVKQLQARVLLYVDAFVFN